jgi:CRISPR/Cas system CSM-associated protein Csm2 small subunit
VEAQQQFKMENQYSVQRKLARELEDLRGTLEEHMKKTGEYDKELQY